MGLINFRNSKLHKDRIGDFKLPAGKTCPFAGICAEWCYAKTGTFRFRPVKAIQERTLLATKLACFVPLMVGEIDEAKGRMNALRIHSAGDFYSQAYFDRWLEIAYKVPYMLLYAYTTSLPFIRWNMLPDNFTIIQSSEGKIPPDKRRKHSVVFPTEEEAIEAGYILANKSDLVVFESGIKFGLVAHGERAKLIKGRV